jgi:hypothetical protein
VSTSASPSHSADGLRHLGSDDLVAHVRTAVTGTGRPSTYLRQEGTPAVRISPYPKRRRPAAPWSRAQVGPTYADFFVPSVADERRVEAVGEAASAELPGASVAGAPQHTAA